MYNKAKDYYKAWFVLGLCWERKQGQVLASLRRSKQAPKYWSGLSPKAPIPVARKRSMAGPTIIHNLIR